MSDNQTISVTLTGRDNLSRTFTAIGREATTAGQSMQRAGQTGQRAFDGLGREGAELGRILDAIERNTAEAARGIDRLGQASGRAVRGMDAVERSATRQRRSWTELGAGITTALGVLSDWSNAAAQEEAIFAGLEQAIDNTGQSFDELAPSIDAAIAGAERLSFADDSAALAIQRLTETTGSGTQALDLLGLAMDLARAKGIDLAAAATIVGRVAEGNTAILTRYGIAIEEGATAQEALASLQQRFAGQAETYADSTAGSIDRIRNSFDNWAESVGASTGELQTLLALLPGLSVGWSAAGAVIGKLAESTRLAAVATNPLALGIGGVAAAAGSAALAVKLYGDRQDDARVSAAEATTIINDLAAAYTLLAEAGTDAFALDVAAGSLRFLGDLTTASREAQSSLDDLGESGVAIVEVGKGIADIFGDATGAFDLTSESTQAMVDELEAAALTEPELRAVEAALAAIGARIADPTAGNRFELATALNTLISDWQEGRITADELYAALVDLSTQTLTYGGAADEAAAASGSLAASITALDQTVRGHVAILEEAADVTDEQREAASRLTAALDAENAARATGRAGQQQARDDRQAEAEAIVAQRDALFDLMFVRDDEIATLSAVGGAYASNIALFDAAAGAIDRQTAELTEYQAALRLAGDGVLSLADQQAILTTRQDELGGALGDYRTQLGYTEEAERILRERQAAGLALTQQQIDFLTTIDATQATAAGSAEDLAIQQGILAQSWLENAESQQALADSNNTLSDTFGELTELMGDFLADWRELLGLPPADNLAVPDDVIESWFNLDNAIKAARGTAGDASGGPNVDPVTGVPANQPPPSQETLQPPLVGRLAEGITLTVNYDYSQVVTGTAVVEDLLTGVTGREWVADLFADAAALNRTAGAAEDELNRVVDAEYIADLLADRSDLSAEVDGAHRELDGLDGRTVAAYVNAYADIRAARNAISSLTGYQGDAYIYAYTIPAGIGPTGLTRQHGGLVSAQHGRVVQMAEAGPEWVTLPDGSGFLAARHGNYVLPGGSSVMPASATAAAGLDRAGGLTININAPVFGVDDLERHLFSALARAASVGVPLRRIEVGMR